MSRDDQAEQRHRLQVEEPLVRRCQQTVERTVSQIRTREGADGSFKLEDAEMKILRDLSRRNVLQGMAAGVVSLLVLRRIRIGVVRRLDRHQAQQKKRGVDASSPFQQQIVSTTTTKQQRPRGLLNAFGWLIDGFSASCLGVAVVILGDRGATAKAVTSLPLVAGKSTVAKEFCPAVVEEMLKMQRDGAMNSEIKECLDHPTSAYLIAFLEFGRNCQRRAAYEQQLRQEKGVSASEPIDVPPPGVPAAFPIDSSLGQGEFSDGDWQSTPSESQQDLYDPSSEGKNGSLDHFVTDREDDGRR